MNIRFVSVAVNLTLGFAVPSSVDAQETPKWTPCKAPVEIAKRAYVRIQQAKTKTLAHERKYAFWDVHEFSHNCQEVSALAAQLQAAGLGRDTSAPQDSVDILGSNGVFSLPSACGAGECKILITKPGTGNAKGLEIRDLYMLDRSIDAKSATPIYTWRQLDVSSPPIHRSSTQGSPK